MLTISCIKIEGLQKGCVTDKRPMISFSLESDKPGESLEIATIRCGDWEITTCDQINNLYGGPLQPFTQYDVKIIAEGTSGDKAEEIAYFETGRLDTPWTGKWITDASYDFGKGESPVPMEFSKKFSVAKPVKRAWINATAFGIYELVLNGKKVGEDYFAPGFTSYAHQMQYQTYDITYLLTGDNTICATVAGGWAVGTFGLNRKNKISADRQALLAEIHIIYEDGTKAIIGTDESWNVALDGPYRHASWYDGEEFDARLSAKSQKNADIFTPKMKPNILAQYGCPVRKTQILRPVSCNQAPSGEYIYDFGQNFAGVISAKINGNANQTVTFRHAEVLVEGELFTKALRTAKAAAVYHCKDGQQSYSPRFTYMGFRYVGVSGIAPEDLELEAFVLHSDFETVGEFSCSNEDLNKLHSNIRWGGKSNFVDIPTDCPQRDERLGWTGDIAVFAKTACYNFDMSRFLDKWLMDMRSEQGKGGGIPFVIPKHGDSWPTMASACWGDSCILVPWAEYLARGNVELLRKQYPTMKKFLDAFHFWAGMLSWNKDQKNILQLPYHWGDWCAPEGNVTDWIWHAKWVATAYWANSSNLVSQIADILGYEEDSHYYRTRYKEISVSYRNVFTDGKGKLKKEFQTAYVLPLAFGMVHGEEAELMAENLLKLINANGGHLATGFPGTPHILFALSDYGMIKEAYDLLLKTDCPSWLYSVKAGGTTIWERWDALRPDGSVNTGSLTSGKDAEDGGMVSFNHYANGAVGDWLYRRCLGLEPISGGYKTFRMKPLSGGGITWVNGSVICPYGKINAKWTCKNGIFTVQVTVPVSTYCELVMPNGEIMQLNSGTHEYTCPLE